MRDNVLLGEVTTNFVGSNNQLAIVKKKNNQLADMLSKPLRGSKVESICNRLGAYVCSSLKGSVRKSCKSILLTHADAD